MFPPRRPRGEKPAVTIRYLRRQIANMEAEIIAVRLANEDKDKVIAGYDVQLSEAQDTADQITQSSIDRRNRYEIELAAARVDAARLAYLEGYHAKSQETAQANRPPLYAPRSLVIGDQPETHARQRPGNPQDLPSGRQAAEGARLDDGAAGARSGFSDKIRRQRGDHQADQERDAVEHVEITEYTRHVATDADWLEP